MFECPGQDPKGGSAGPRCAGFEAGVDSLRNGTPLADRFVWPAEALGGPSSPRPGWSRGRGRRRRQRTARGRWRDGSYAGRGRVGDGGRDGRLGWVRARRWRQYELGSLQDRLFLCGDNALSLAFFMPLLAAVHPKRAVVGTFVPKSGRAFLALDSLCNKSAASLAIFRQRWQWLHAKGAFVGSFRVVSGSGRIGITSSRQGKLAVDKAPQAPS